jgi:hypothetical protein
MPHGKGPSDKRRNVHFLLGLGSFNPAWPKGPQPVVCHIEDEVH